MQRKALSNSVRAAVQGYKGGETPRAAVEAPDSLHSIANARLIDLIGEGELEGFVHGEENFLQDCYFDETPVENADGSKNFKSFIIDFRPGTQSQSYIPGFPAVENEVAVGVELTAAQPWVQAISNKELSAVRVRLSTPALSSTDTETGDTSGTKVEYAIDVATDGGAFVERMKSAFNGKTTSSYERGHRIDLPTATDTGWLIRVRRITPDSSSVYVQNSTFVVSMTEIIDGKFRYPNSGLVGVQIDASQFQSIPTRAYHMRGRRLKVPSNYDPIARTYSGVWDGTFKTAYSNNPAWVFYDLATHPRFGLGHLVSELVIDKWSLYAIAQYCDELVPDDNGGMEPRMVCNIYLQKASDAYRVLSDLASVFRGICYWSAGSIVPVSDRPTDPVYTYTNSNVVDGAFIYESSGRRARHTAVTISYNDINDFGRLKTDYYDDPEAIDRYGYQPTDVVAIGAGSRSQARRQAKWLLLSEKLLTNAVTFSVGKDGTFALPGQIVRIADRHRAGRRMGGRVTAATINSVTLDVMPEVPPVVNDIITVILSDGKSQSRTIQTVVGDTVTTTIPFTEAPSVESVWAIDSSDLNTQMFRVLSVAENEEGTHTLYCLQHNPSIFDAVDLGEPVEERPISVIIPGPVQPPVASVTISMTERASQTIVSPLLVATWTPAPGATSYEVQWQKDNGNWTPIEEVRTGVASEYPNPFPGTFMVRVVAVNAIGIKSIPVYSDPYLMPDQTKPPGVIDDINNDLDDLDNRLIDEINTRIAEDLLNAQNLAQEILDRIAEDTALSGDIAANAQAIADENAARMAQYATLSQDLADESSARAAEYALLAQADADEAAARAAGDAAAVQALADEATARNAAIAAAVQASADALEAEIAVVRAQVGDIMGADDWDINHPGGYPSGDLVKNAGTLYRAKMDVPEGTDITNTTYWESIGNYSSLGEAVSATAVNVANLTSDLSALSQTVVTHGTRLGTAESTLTTLQQSMATADAALAQDITDLEAVVNNPTTGLAATATGLVALTGRVTTNEESFSSLSQSLTKLESQIKLGSELHEELNLMSETLDPRITYTRTGPKTYFDKSGVMRVAADNVWPLEYDPVTHELLGRSVWPSKTNLVKESGNLAAAVWSGGVVTSNATMAPDGTVTADKVAPPAGAYNYPGGALTQTINRAIGVPVVFSAFVKMAELPIAVFTFTDRTNVFGGIAVDLRTGAVIETDGANQGTISNVTVVALPEGWYRISFRHAGDGVIDSSNGVGISGAPDGLSRYVRYVPTSWTSDGVNGIYVWGVQAETYSWIASPYIPTLSGTVARGLDSADVFDMDAVGYNPEEYTVVVQCIPPSVDSHGLVAIRNGATNSNQVMLYRNTTTGNVQIRSAGVTVAQLTMNPAAGGFIHRMVAAVAKDNFAATHSGYSPWVDSSGALPIAADRITIGSGAGVSALSGWVQWVRLYPKRLSNDQIQTLTGSADSVGVSLATAISDLSTRTFQNENGIAAAAQDIVALQVKMGDELLGPELIENGDLSEGLTGFTSSGATPISLDDYGILLNKTSNASQIEFPISIEDGKSYRLEFDWRFNGTGSTVAGVRIGTFYLGNIPAGHVSIIVSGAGTPVGGLIGSSTYSTSMNASFKNFTMREIISASDLAEATATLTATVIQQGEDIASSSAEITTLKNTVNNPTTGVVATSNALSSLTSDVSILEGVVVSQGTSITNLQNTINDPSTGLAATAAALASLTTTVSQNGNNIVSVTNRVVALEATVDDPETGVVANATSVADLLARVTVTEAGISANAQDIVTLQSDLTSLDGVVDGQATSISNLLSRMTTAEGTITSHSSSLTSLDNRLTTAETGLAGASSAIAGLQSTVTQHGTDITAVANDVTALQAQVGTEILGPELINDPNFDGASLDPQWGVVNATSSIVDGNLVLTASGTGDAYAEYAVSGLTVGVDYRIEILAKRGSQGTTQAYSVATFTGGSDSRVPITTSDFQMYGGDLPVNESSGYVRIFAISGAGLGAIGDQLVVQRVSVREITPTSQADAINALDVRTQQTESGLATSASDITALELVVNDPTTGVVANASAIQTLDTRLVTAEGSIASQSAAITALQNTVNDPTTGLGATAAGLNSLITRVTANEGDISSISADVTSLTNRITDAEGDVTANANAISGLDTRVTQTESGVASASAAITALENTVNDPVTGVAANASAITGLDSRVTANEGTITSQGSAITSLQNTVNDPSTGVAATASALSTLTTRVTSAEGDIDSLSSSITSINSALSGKADASALSALTTRVTDAEGTISTLVSDVNSLETSVAGKAAASALDALTTRVTTAEGDIDSLSSAITQLQTDVAGKASASALNSLTTRVTSAEGDIDSLSSSLTSLSNTVDGKASVSALNALTTRVTNVEGVNTSQASSISSLQSTVNDPSTGVAATASAVQSLTTRVTTAEGKVSTLSAAYQVTLDVNGYFSGFTSINNGTSSLFQIKADKFKIIPSSASGARTEYSDGNWRIYDSAGVLRVRLGVW